MNIYLETIDSTQNYAKEHLHNFAEDVVTCILAEEQTAGRGRFQRPWFSPKRKNLYVTFCFQIAIPATTITSIVQVMALSIAKTLIKYKLFPKIKWPNDILLGGKKIGGVLCETEIQLSKTIFYLGMGLNVNMEKNDLLQINQPASSLLIETEKSWDKDELLLQIQKQFDKDLDVFIKEGFYPFHFQFENLLAFKGEVITITDGKKILTGICHSVSSDGKLNLSLPNGDITTLCTGDISFKTEKNNL